MGNGGQAGGDWAGAVHRVFGAHCMGLVAYVPDAGLAGLIELCRADEGIVRRRAAA